MAEFASKGVAGTGLGLGIAGTALSLLNNGNGGVLGGLLGGGNQNMQSLTDNRRLRDETFAYLKPLSDEL